MAESTAEPSSASVLCRVCGVEWSPESTPLCPTCLASRWLSTPNLIREKHDPRELGGRLETYRSVVTPRVLLEIRPVLEFAAVHGTWFLDTFYEMFVHVTPQPLGRNAGVGIPAGQREPEHALDCLFIAEADSAETAHVFAVNGERHAAQVRAGVFVPLGSCADCSNHAPPGRDRCILHAPPENSEHDPLGR
jgi:hypothetical protein